MPNPACMLVIHTCISHLANPPLEVLVAGRHDEAAVLSTQPTITEGGGRLGGEGGK
jgi:hypothetical protein